MAQEGRVREATRQAIGRTGAALLGLLTLASAVILGFTQADAAPSAEDQAAAIPVAVAARLVEYDSGARLTFDLSAPVEGRAFALADPDRIVVDVPEVNFQIDPAVGRPQPGRALGGIVKSFRFGLLGPGKSRIVIDLNGPARIERLSTVAIAKGAQAARLQIDLGRCEPAVFLQSVKEAEPTAPPRPGRRSSCSILAMAASTAALTALPAWSRKRWSTTFQTSSGKSSKQ